MIVGVSGYGKTELTRHIINKFLAQGQKLLVYNSEHEKAFTDLDEEFRYRPKIPTTYKNKKEFHKLIAQEFDEVCRDVFKQRNIVFCVESIDLFCPSYLPLPPNFWQIVNHGRKRKIGLIMTSRSCKEVSKQAVRNCTHWFVFYTFAENDIKWLKDSLGKEAEKAQTLKKYYFLYFNPETKGGKGIVCAPIPLIGER